MPENPYHQIPYTTAPMADIHPDRLAAVASLFGMTPAPVTSCRVLEVGCGSGANLIPMAYRLPGSQFTGVDLAEMAIVEGRRVARELAVANLDLIAMDLCEIGPALGEFDYIIAHGVYSWVPDHVRDPLLALCRERLAPQGVAYVSYNALPGRYVRTMLRDMMLYHVRNRADPRECLDGARSLLRKVGEAHLVTSAWQPMVEEEIRQTLNADDGWLFHDDLAPVNDAFYFHDFASRAAGHSLQYLGDIIEREQYFDFLSFRSFRQTLLCRAGVQLERPAGPERMDRFLFSSPARQSQGQIHGLHSVCINEAKDDVARVAVALGAVYPQPVAFDKLLESEGDREALRAILFSFISSGFAAFHVHDFAAAGTAGPRPRANRLARWESAHTGAVTYSNHATHKLDGMVRALIELLDGTREFDSLASGLAQLEGAPPLEDIRAGLPRVLTHMAHAGLLE